MSEPEVKECCVRNCPSKSLGGIVGVQYFNLPLDLEWRMNWLKAIGVQSGAESKNQFVCSIHFKPAQIKTIKNLLPEAVPTRLLPVERKGEIKICSTIQTQTDFSSSDDSSDEGNTIYDSDGNSICSNNSKKRSGILKNYLLKPNDAVTANNGKDSDRTVNYKNLNNFLEWKDRSRNRRKGKKLEKDFLLFALKLHTSNTRAYKLLKKTWNLPPETQLKDVKLRIEPKLDDLVMSLLSNKVKALSNNAMYCTLNVYAVDLKPHFFYDPANDNIVGIHDVNGVRSAKVARHALVVMVRGIKVDWHLPVQFAFFSSMTDLEGIEVFLLSVLKKLQQIKIKIMALIGPEHEWFEKYLRSKKFISLIRPYAMYNSEPLHVLYDIPHCLNNLIDCLMKYDLVYRGATISWKHIKQLKSLLKYNQDKFPSTFMKERSKQDNSEMSSKYQQAFNKSVIVAMSFYIDNNKMSEEARPTLDFIDKMCEIFNTLNSTDLTDVIRGPRDNGRSTESSHRLRSRAQFKAIEDGYLLIKELKAFKDGNDVTKEVKCIEHFTLTLKALMAVSSLLRNTTQIGIVLTSRLNLKQMEEFINLIKNESGKRPSTAQFSKAFSKYFVKYLVELTPPPSSIGCMKMDDGVKASSNNGPSEKIHVKTTDYRFELPEENSLIYLCSYLIYKCSMLHKCDDFKLYLKNLMKLKDVKPNLKGFNKDAVFYNKLKYPFETFVEYVENLDACFINEMDSFHRKYPAQRVYDALKNIPQCEWPCHCFPVKYLLKLFIRARIYETLMYNKRCMKKVLESQSMYKFKSQKLL